MTASGSSSPRPNAKAWMQQQKQHALPTIPSPRPRASSPRAPSDRLRSDSLSLLNDFGEHAVCPNARQRPRRTISTHATQPAAFGATQRLSLPLPSRNFHLEEVGEIELGGDGMPAHSDWARPPTPTQPQASTRASSDIHPRCVACASDRTTRVAPAVRGHAAARIVRSSQGSRPQGLLANIVIITLRSSHRRLLAWAASRAASRPASARTSPCLTTR